MEGNKVKEPGRIYHGKHMINGWKNFTPWNYDLDLTKVWTPKGEELETVHSTLDI